MSLYISYILNLMIFVWIFVYQYSQQEMSFNLLLVCSLAYSLSSQYSFVCVVGYIRMLTLFILL